MGSPEKKRFGRYEVLGELGRGAMGVVYKARDPQIERTVAVKTVSLWNQEPEAEQEYRLRFKNEAQAAGRLHHPGIVSVFDVGEDPESRDPYIVLEYVAGEALNRILSREKKLPLGKSLLLAIEIAEALDYAHAQGVTHRDIKPGNILITQEGRAKVADFGIAKLNLAHFTLPGKVLGTPAFMAPEQLSGEAADGRSDLFSLGVILYVMVTGHSPFPGNSATTVCFKVVHREPVAASVLDLNLPRELDAVIARAMAKDPDERYQTGVEFAADLRALTMLEPRDATTTSLDAMSGILTRSTSRTGVGRTGARKRAAGPGDFGSAVVKGPAKLLTLGVFAVLLLAIVTTQLKRFPPAPQPPVVGTTIQTGVPTVVSRPETDAPAPTAPKPAKASPKRTSMKPAPRMLAPLPAQQAPALSTVEVAVQHQFKDATLSVWVDDKLALTRTLHGGTQKRLVVFSGGVHGTESETLKVPVGEHVLRLRAQTADQTIDLSKTISAQLTEGDDKTLLVTFDKRNTAMHLEWQ